MRILFELSKEHPTLPIAEIRMCLYAEGINAGEIYHNDIIYIIEIEPKSALKIRDIINRLALSYSVNEILGRSVEACLNKIPAGKTFKVIGGSQNIREHLGKLLTTKGISVDLQQPDIIFTVFQNNQTKPYFSNQLGTVDRHAFERRRPSARPYAVPTTLHPRLARALINLAGIRKGDVLLDPFCGTGGILLEAGLLGIKIRGIEIKPDIINGCKKNLAWYNITPDELLIADMRFIKLKQADAVVTDFPYGRAAHLSDTRENLYRDAFEQIAGCSSKAVIGLPSLSYRKNIARYFDIIQIHCVRVHKSLIRYFYVLRS